LRGVSAKNSSGRRSSVPAKRIFSTMARLDKSPVCTTVPPNPRLCLLPRG
jgi:hypothetical protein